MRDWLKAGNFVAAAAGTALVSLLLWLFLDPVLKRILISAGQAAAGAKVEIGAVRTKVLSGRLELSRVAVADANSPMTNLVELESAAFQLLPGQALRGKAVVPEASLSGLRFATPRKTSGALPRAKPSALSLAVQKQLAPVKTAALSELSQVKAKAVALDPANLASLRSLDELEARLKAAPGQWKEKVNAEKLEAQFKEVEAAVQAVQKGGNSPADIVRKAQAAAAAQKKIKALLDEAKASKAAAQKELDEIQAAFKKAEALKGKDLNGLLEAAGLPALDAESLSRRLLGAQSAGRLATALHWLKWAKGKSAARAAAAPEKPPRRRGLDLEFPVPGAYPALLLEKASLSGTLDGVWKGEALAVEGLLRGLTSNAPLHGKPLTLSLKGAAARGPRAALDVLVDQTTAGGPAELSLKAEGIPLSGAELGDSELGATLTAGAARVSAALRLVGEKWEGKAVLAAEGVSLEPRLKLEGPAGRFAAEALRGVKRFTVTVGIAGKEDDLKLSLSSDLGQVLADGVKRAVAAEFAAQRKVLEDKLNALYSEKARGLRAQADGLRGRLLGPLDAQQKRLEEQLRKAAGGNLQKRIPALDGLFKRR